MWTPECGHVQTELVLHLGELSSAREEHIRGRPTESRRDTERISSNPEPSPNNFSQTQLQLSLDPVWGLFASYFISKGRGAYSPNTYNSPGSQKLGARNLTSASHMSARHQPLQASFPASEGVHPQGAEPGLEPRHPV